MTRRTTIVEQIERENIKIDELVAKITDAIPEGEALLLVTRALAKCFAHCCLSTKTPEVALSLMLREMVQYFDVCLETGCYAEAPTVQ